MHAVVAAEPIPVVLYHAIGDSPRPGIARFTLSDAAFAEHLARLSVHRDTGATPLLMTNLSAVLEGTAPLPERPFAVTFDDGYGNNYAAILALADAGIPSTIFVTTTFIDQPGMLTAAQVRELAEHPLVEVGAHGVTHVRLDELPRADIARELQVPRVVLRRVTGRELTAVAYPYGAHDRRVLDEARRAGYRSGAAVKNVLSRLGDDPLAVARWTVLDTHNAHDLGSVLLGGIGVVGSSERWQTRGFRLVRRACWTVRRVAHRDR